MIEASSYRPGRAARDRHPEHLQRLAGTFGVLSDGTRLTILSLLAGGEQDVSSLCRVLSVSQPTVSHHLGLLRASGLVHSRREGKRVFYGLNHPTAAAEGTAILLETNGCHVRMDCPPAGVNPA